jgi:hypothetical protein
MQISFTKRKVHFVYIALAVVSLLLAGVSHVRAQEMTDPGSSQGQREIVRDALDTRRASLTEEQQNRFINLVRNVFTRMEGAIARLESVAGRIETRVVALEAQGVDTTRARTPLSEAQNKLTVAKSQLAQAKATAESGIVSDTPRERFVVAREEFSNIRQTIRDSYILLREALAELKDAVMEADLNKNGRSGAVTNGSDVKEVMQ